LVGDMVASDVMDGSLVAAKLSTGAGSAYLCTGPTSPVPADATRCHPRSMTASTSTEGPRLILRTPEDVLAKVPFLVGFHPAESLVALAFGADRQIQFTTRVDLPDEDLLPGPPPAVDDWERDAYADYCDEVRDLATHLASVFDRRGVAYTLLVAYTSHRQRARPVLDEVAGALGRFGVDVLDILVADGCRWWSEACRDPRCCPPGGTPYDLPGHPITARSVFAGEVALSDEDALRRSLDLVDGSPHPEMLALARRVEAAWKEGRVRDGRPGESVVAEESALVAELTRRLVDGSEPLSDEEVARACVLVSDVRVRDEVWSRMSRASAPAEVTAWSELVRRMPPPLDVAPATLLAFASWLSGNGALARCALERAFASDPDYSMAHLVGQLLMGAVPPDIWSESVDAA
jgi:Domain of unknown function (DUF4192)